MMWFFCSLVLELVSVLSQVRLEMYRFWQSDIFL